MCRYLKYRPVNMSTARNTAKQSSPVGSKRSLKRDRLIELASIQMNRRGAASVDLAQIGAEMGMSRNTVYYYFKDKNALTSACYEAAAQHAESALEAAHAFDGNCFERISTFVGHVLSEDAHSVAVMSDLDLASESVSKNLGRRQSKVLQGLQELVEAGIAEGEFRELSPELVSQVLLSMLEWKRLWSAFMGQGPDSLTEGAKDIIRWMSQGVIVDRLYHLSDVPSLDDVIPSSVDVMDPGSISEQKRTYLLGAASALFNSRGIAATTIDDIARALNSTKGFVYHYVDDKEHLVRLCYDRAFDVYERILVVSEDRGLGSADSIISSLHLNVQAQLSDCPPITVQSQLGDLPSVYRKRSASIWNRYVANVRRAIRNKVAHPGSEKLVDVSAGTFFWLGRSGQSKFSSKGAPDEIVDLFAHGLCS